MFLLLPYSCKEKYTLPKTLADKSYLVVEGFINSGNDSTRITLSRTVKIDTFAVSPEANALVSIESTNGNSFDLEQTDPGVYTCPPIPVSAGEEFRLVIRTANNNIYESDWTEAKFTPEIDSISWTREASGVQINVNTHDIEDKSRYYIWQFEETWDFYSHEWSSFDYVDSMVRRNYPDSIFHCWQFFNSRHLILGSSAKLSSDVIYQFPLIFIPDDSWKISSLYSILVKQRVLSKGAYEYLDRMKKNSEQMGTIFDPQPSGSSGNIRCVTHPEETVIGYVYVSSVTEKRIFIRVGQVYPWRYRLFCEEKLVPADSLRDFFSHNDLITKEEFTPLYIPIRKEGTSYWGARVGCMDCTTKGVHRKPDYWP